MKTIKRFFLVLCAVCLLTAFAMSGWGDVSAQAADGLPTMTYELLLTDGEGRAVENPRALSAGDRLNIEILLTRTDILDSTYPIYGIEFRLLTSGLTYNYDGISPRSDTDVHIAHYMDGDYVGYAWYDLQRVGEMIGNPVIAGAWSYTVDDPSSVNIQVPVTLMYVPPWTEDLVPVGKARLTLDPNGGEIVGKDVSGIYDAGTVVTLPGAELPGYDFEGWSDGSEMLYPEGYRFTVTGIVTLVAQYKDLDRSRHVLLDPNGGVITGVDISGWYADGEVVLLPAVEYEGHRFLGWDDGLYVFDQNEEYTVYNTVVIRARWEEGEPIEELQTPTSPLIRPFLNDDGSVNAGRAIGLGLGLGALGLWLILLLWKRRWVLYSLKNGDVALSCKEKDYDFRVEVILFADDEDGNRAEYHLNRSGVVEAGHRLRFIHGQTETYPIVEVEKGKYKGKLIITDPEENVTERKARIKVLDRELKERKNR